MHQTLFFICGGVLAASAVIVSFVGLKSDNFPGKWMPLIVVWFAAFAVGAGTFAVLHGKDESKDHDKEYAKASAEMQYESTEGPFVRAQEEEAEEAKAEEGESAEGEAGESAEPAEGGEAEGGSAEGGEEGGEAEGGGNAEAGATVFSTNCAACHGDTGHGGAGGPDLTTMPLAQTEEGAIKQVTNGGGGMPPFSGTLSEEEIENVAAYVVHEVVGK
ncbi:MAG: c-type cytochrome [Actinobacteria bacterium]|nr:c-type cytochrome [Actinomycetota bacterium]